MPISWCKIQNSLQSPETTIYKVDNLSQDSLNSLLEFESLKEISFMPKYELSLDTLDGSESNIDVIEPQKDVNYPIIGVLDSGVSENVFLKPWLHDRWSAYPDDYINEKHGTFVAGILLYGDQLEGKEYVGGQGFKILDAVVYPDTSKEGIDEDDLITNIQTVIKKFHDKVKIWNMSLGTNLEIEDDEFSDFGIALDNIQSTYEVLICKSAGNCKNFIGGRPVSKLAKSADSVHALTVGSIAHKKENGDIAEVNHPSPFSRIGRGPAHIVKPELVSYGGNAGINESGRLKQTGVRSFTPNGEIAMNVGTSFSTPRVTSLLGNVELYTKGEFNPLLSKALAIHSANYPENLTLKMKDRLEQLGFGIHGTVNDIIFNDENEVTLILQDTLEKGEFMEILEFPFPKLIDDDGYFYGDIKVTMVEATNLSENQGIEYCQSNLEVLFGSYDSLKSRDVSKPSILNPIGPSGNKNLLRDSCYSAKHKKDIETEYATERILVNYGDKFHPVKKYNIRLNEMTPSNKNNFLKKPKKWFLKVRGLFRENAETTAIEDGELLSQEYCLIITIKDPLRKVNVYNDVNNQLDTNGFNHTSIQLNERVVIQ